MRFRKLRIAWSVVCGLLAVLLIVMCARSYWWRDSFYRDPMPTSDGELRDCIGIISFHGNVIFTKYADPFSDADGWGIENARIDENLEIPATTLGFALRRDTDGFSISMPYWLFFVLVGAIVLLSLGGIRRFSLRTLLIALTMIAVVLGLVVYATR
jgi:hypothetical protein